MINDCLMNGKKFYAGCGLLPAFSYYKKNELVPRFLQVYLSIRNQ